MPANIMKPFWKYTGIAIGIQIIIFAAVIAITYLSANDSIMGALLVYLYFPTVWLISVLGNFKGESAMINPILYGVPLGILLYAIITGTIFSYVKRGRKPA